MKTFTKRELAALERAVEILNAKTEIDSELYEKLVDDGCQPSTAAATLLDIIASCRNLSAQIKA